MATTFVTVEIPESVRRQVEEEAGRRCGYCLTSR